MKPNFAVRIYRRIMYPHLKGEFFQQIRCEKPHVLDVGCGNNSPSQVKSMLPLVFTPVSMSPITIKRNRILPINIFWCPQVSFRMRLKRCRIVSML